MSNRWTISFLIALTGLAACKRKIPYRNLGHYDCQLPFADSSSAKSFMRSTNTSKGITGEGVPGIVMSIVQPGTGLWTGASGMADLAGGVTLQPCNNPAWAAL